MFVGDWVSISCFCLLFVCVLHFQVAIIDNIVFPTCVYCLFLQKDMARA